MTHFAPPLTQPEREAKNLEELGYRATPPQNQNPSPQETGSEVVRLPSSILFIRDDYGYAWTFDGTRIVTLHDLLQEAIGVEELGTGGYPCNSWEEGIRILNDGYITGTVEEQPNGTENLEPDNLKDTPEPQD